MVNKQIKPFQACPICKKDWKYKVKLPNNKKKGLLGLKVKKYEVYSHLIGIEDPRVYDGVSWWMCPFCKTKWSRWSGEIVK